MSDSLADARRKKWNVGVTNSERLSQHDLAIGLAKDGPYPGAATLSLADRQRAVWAAGVTNPSKLSQADLETLSVAGGGSVNIVTDYVALQRVASISVPFGTGTYIPWDTVDSDASGYFSAGANTRITVPAGKGGKHLFTLAHAMSGGVGNRGFSQVEVYNASNVLLRTLRAAFVMTNGAGEDRGHMTTVIDLNATDYIRPLMYEESSNNLSLAKFEMIRFG